MMRAAVPGWYGESLVSPGRTAFSHFKLINSPAIRSPANIK